MISYYARRSSGEEFKKLTTPISNGVWVFGESLSDGELFELTKKFQLDRNIITDLKDVQELPRIEFSDGYEYVFLRIPKLSKRGHVITSPLLAVVGKTNYFTLSVAGNSLPKELIATGSPPLESSNSTLLLGTIAALISSYETLILQTSLIIKNTGSRLRSHDVNNRDFIHFVTVEDNLNEYKMNLGGMLSVVRRLGENKHGFFREADCESIDDIALHIQQLLVAVESYSQNIESIRNAYSTVANYNMNERIKTLTVFTVLITLPNVFFGMYGMNVALPFADQPWAYSGVVILVALSILVIYVLAKRFRIF